MADKYIISKSKLTAIADAIRTKTGETGTLTADQMAEEIAGISAGDAISEFATKYINGELDGEVVMPDGLKSAPPHIFSLYGMVGYTTCRNALTSIDINDMESIPPYFAYLQELQNITFNSVVKYIGDNAFTGTNVKKLYIPNSIDNLNVGTNAFSSTPITSVDICRPVTFSSYVFVHNTTGEACTVKLRKASVFDGRDIFQYMRGESSLVLYTGDCVANNSYFLKDFEGKLYVPRAYLADYKAKTNFVAYANQIYPAPRYISYTAPDGTCAIVNTANDGIQTASPLTTTYDTTAITFVNPDYDVKAINIDMTSTDYLDTYDLGAVTLTQTDPVVTIAYPAAGTLTVNYSGAKFNSTADGAGAKTFRIKAGETLSYTWKQSGYKPYTKTLTTTGGQTVTIAESDMTVATAVAVDITVPDAGDPHLANLVDGSNFEIADGKIRSGSKSHNVSKGSSFGYITINTPSDGGTCSIKYAVSSEANWDFGYFTIISATAGTPKGYDDESALKNAQTNYTEGMTCYDIQTEELLARYSGTDSGTITIKLAGGTTYYIGIGYIKDDGGNTNDDRFYINEIKYTTVE